MKKRFGLIVAVMLVQLSVFGVCFADDSTNNNTQTVVGFVFQDNNNNGEFDEADNTFPCALIKIQAVDSEHIEFVPVDHTGYFEAPELADGTYNVWAEYYGLIGIKQRVDIGQNNDAGMLMMGLGEATSLERHSDEASVGVPQMETDMNQMEMGIPQAETDMNETDMNEMNMLQTEMDMLQMKMDMLQMEMNEIQADAGNDAPSQSFNIMLPFVSG